MPNPDGADPHVLHPDHHPTPFSAAEIRAGSQPGRTVRQLIEVEGAPPVTRVLQWVSVDDHSGTGVSWTTDAAGNAGEIRHSRSTWLELQEHASMPIATTTIDEVVLDSPMGPLDCLRYTTVDGDAVKSCWFARTYPGMPVMTERTESGRVVERVIMLSSRIEPIEATDWSP